MVTIVVTDKDEKRRNPEYSLQRVRELAAAGHVRYLSTTVERDVENLEFVPNDVHRCLAGLEERHFHQSIRYTGKRYWLDVYRISCQGQAIYSDSLYKTEARS
jgi:hypothetical protein